MDVLTLSWLVTAVGLVLFHAALIMTVRANPNTSIPVYRNAEIIPTGSVALRVSGAGLFVLGMVLLSTDAWYWPFAVVLAGPIAGATVVMFHNKKVAARAT